MHHAFPDASDAPDALTPSDFAESADFWLRALHQLAQPVQAMALFSAQLRALPLGSEAAPVVAHLGASVLEMQELLQRLAQVAALDLHLLNMQAVPVDTLFGLLHSPASAHDGAKTHAPGKGLRWRSQGQVVQTDAVLLARLLQLVIDHAISDALKVTTAPAARKAKAGGVLVAWRNLRGQGAVRMELWWATPDLAKPALASALPAGAPLATADRSALDLAHRLAGMLGSPFALRVSAGGLACLSLHLPLAACGEA